MSEETTSVEGAQDTVEKHEETVAYERFQQVNRKAREATEANKSLQRQLDELKAQMEERESAGLPELDRERKRAEQLEKRAAEAERKAAQADAQLARSAKEQWVSAAAKDFTDPADAAAFLNLDDIEDEKDAERAVKALAKRKPHLLKSEDAPLPGKVLTDGRRPVERDVRQPGFDKNAEAEMVGSALADFLKSRQQTGISFGA